MILSEFVNEFLGRVLGEWEERGMLIDNSTT